MSHELSATPEKQRVAGLALSWGLLVILTMTLQAMIPAFDSVFSSFGADLPALTIFTQKFFRLAILLPGAAVLVWAFWPDRKRSVRAAILFCWASILLTVLMAGTMYLPILRLGAVV